MYIIKALLLGVSLSLAQASTAQLTERTPSNLDDERRPSVEAAVPTAAENKEPKKPENFQPINGHIYGAGVPTLYGVKDAAQKAEQYVAPVPVAAASILAGSEVLAEGDANRAAANREKASVTDSVGAGMSRLADTLASSRKPAVQQDPHFNAGNFMRDVVDFQLNLSDERFMLEAQSEQEARRRLDVLREQHRASEVWQQNSQRITSLVGIAIAVALVLWWWLSRSSRTKTKATVWIVRVTALVGSFYLHWAFGLFMLVGLYTHTTRLNRR